MAKPAPTWEAEELHYTVKELAGLWKVNADELRRAACQGAFPRAWKVGRDWRIPASDANAYRLARRASVPA